MTLVTIGFTSCSDDESDNKTKDKYKEDQETAPAPPVIKPKPKKKADAGGNSAEKAEKTPSYSSGSMKVDSGLAISITTVGDNNKFTLTVNSGQGSSGNSSVGEGQDEPLWQQFQDPLMDPEKTTPSINLKKKGTVADGLIIITNNESAQAFGKKAEESPVAVVDNQ